ncbi:AAA family ATPase [Flaviaesturariibacter aridisoli]|uniref:ATP-binding protein n=1 Tax=Flaviaesturariibacter aridisoli TaxID=2545761 RepID=A0A4R4E4Y2_9BACT|nr:ATP-binding protein [Flaviaesturariibacter aridisoli]TCZ73071.1 ATP-binding protein [Flaviaesturariibacter aridisoli]
MFIDFSVKNFRSIKDLQTISFVATGLKSPEQYVEVDRNNIVNEGELRLLKTVGIYGANASGKSNVVLALDRFMEAIWSEASTESNLDELFQPFLFQTDRENTDIFFQVNFLLEGKKYRYGFTVKKNMEYDGDNKNSRHIISSEWLFGPKEKNVVPLFTRKGLEIKKDKLANHERIPPLQYPHTLFLTHASAFDRESICTEVREFLRLYTLSNVNFKELALFRRSALNLIEDEGRKEPFLAMMSAFGLPYDDVIVERGGDDDSKVVSLDKIFLTRNVVASDGKVYPVKLNLGTTESEGTRKLFDLLGLIYRAFDSVDPAMFILDEIDSNFHPSLLIHLLKMFNNPEINKSNSQLLFTSHDTNLMSPSIMRRDQFFFAEKLDEATKVFSLSDLRGIRNDADFARMYLSGLLGAKPILHDYKFIDSDGSN